MGPALEPPTRLRDDDKAQKKILGTVDKQLGKIATDLLQ